MKPRFPALTLVLACVGCAFGAQLTLDQLLELPYISQLVVSPRGDRLAWVVNDRGRRNIWIAEAPSFVPRQLTRYAEDDGQELSQLRWAPDGSFLVYVRGSPPNREGDYPNPNSLPQPTEQAIWLLPLAGGSPRRIDSGSEPAISPDGTHLVYLKQNRIWVAPLKDQAAPALLLQSRGQLSWPVWSPDGRFLAFVTTRAGYSFVAVYELASSTIRYLDPGVDRDGWPSWSPDSRYLAFIRTPYARVLEVFGPKREAPPWSIHLTEVAAGHTRMVFRASPGRGSVFRPLSSEPQLLWGADNRLVFGWEASGWNHLYSLSLSGSGPVELTPGPGEVDQASLSLDRRWVYYSTNHGDPDRRHIWRVPVSGGKPECLTPGEGIEWQPWELAGGSLALLRSDARFPARPAILVRGKLSDLAPAPWTASFPGQSLVPPQSLVFPSLDGLEIRAQLFLPPQSQSAARRPAVIYLHGGPRRQMLLGWHPAEYYHRAYALNQYLALSGFIVLALNFRSGTGYGLEFREALDYGPAGASEFQDVLAAAQCLRSRSDVDPDRIGLWGGSYGGYLTALALARRPDLFAAGVDLHGVHDWRSETRLFLPTDDLETQQAALRLALASSPLADVSRWRAPVLLIHGDDDRSVEFRQTQLLVEALRRQKVDVELLVFPDEAHNFLTYRRWREALHATAQFLIRRLGSSSAPTAQEGR